MINFDLRQKVELKHFEKMAHSYDQNYQYDKPFTKYKISKKVDTFVKFIAGNQSLKLEILELGCGTGEYSREIAKRLGESQIIALDISEKIIEVARKKCEKFKNIKFSVGSAYQLPFKDKSFDVVAGFYFLHHVDAAPVIKEIRRILSPEGKVFFIEPNILNPLVFLIKSNKFLKKIAGDSLNEWGINPLSVTRYFKGFNFDISTTEFIWPLDFIPKNILIFMDKISQNFKIFPLFKYLGGSVEIHLKKK